MNESEKPQPMLDKVQLKVTSTSGSTIETAGGFTFGQAGQPFSRGTTPITTTSTSGSGTNLQSCTGFGSTFESFLKSQKESLGKLSELLKANREWECDACYVQNAADVRICTACDKLKLPDEPDSSATSGKCVGQVGQSFGFGNTLSGTGFGSMAFGSLLKPQKEAKTNGTIPKSQNKNQFSGKLSEYFEEKLGEWECHACSLQNTADVRKCIACEALRSEISTHEPASSSAISSSAVASSAVFCSAVFSSAVFSSAVSSSAVSSSAVSSSAVFVQAAAAPIGVCQLGSKSGMTGLTRQPNSSISGFTFGPSFTITGDTNVTCSGASSTKEVDSTSDPTFDFGVNGGFSFAGVTPVKQDKPKTSTPRTPTSSMEDGLYVNQHGEDDHIYFKPVVKLPDNVEVTTGEEDEDLLYYHRTKLFRFVENEWKERGVGEVRILRSKQTNKARILMRREQVLKICMNHALSKDLELKPLPNSKGKAWVWHAVDFARDEQTHEQFVIKFGTEEIANSFKDIFEKAVMDPKFLTIVVHKPDSKASTGKKAAKTPVKVKPVESVVRSSTQSPAFSSSFISPELATKSATTLFGFSAGKSSADKQPTSVFGYSSGAMFGDGPGVFGAKPKSFDAREKVKTSGGLLARLLTEPVETGESNSVFKAPSGL